MLAVSEDREQGKGLEQGVDPLENSKNVMNLEQCILTFDSVMRIQKAQSNNKLTVGQKSRKQL